MKQPRTFAPLEKAQVALAAIRGDKTIAQISSPYQEKLIFNFNLTSHHYVSQIEK